MIIRRTAVVAIIMIFSAFSSTASGHPLLVGSYDADRMKSIQPLTLPRLMLYDKNGKIIDRSSWPSELSTLKDKAGEAFCCVSDTPAPSGSKEPPPDCKRIIYGEEIQGHFIGLSDSSGRRLTYESLPSHEYLIVEYYADWCSPCHAARRELEALLSNPAHAGYLGLAIDFSALDDD